MRRFSFIGTFLVVLTLMVGLTWLGLKLVGRSFVPDGEIEQQIGGLSGPVEITRDQNGIPYVTAQNENDAWAAMGYAHAQDRLWQMDLMRRAGEGRLSEIFGRRTIGYDAMLRTIGFQRVAKEITRGLPERTRVALEAYCRGVNAWIEANRGVYPLEFDALDYDPEPWKPEHSVLITRMLAWELNTGFWTDLVFGEIQGKVDSVKFQEILPYYPTDAPTIIPGGQKPEPLLEQFLAPPPPPIDTTRRDSTGVDSLRRDTAARPGVPPISAVISLETEMRQFLGIDGAHIGSNAWVISGKRTASGKPMLANDPHLTHTAPSRWYQAVISFGGQTVAGVTLPGIPFVVIGRNRDIAWGMTSMMVDQTDFYIEKLDSATGMRIERDGQWEKIQLIHDTIRVKDSTSVPFSIRIGRHGPFISDVHPFASTYPLRDSTALPVDTTGLLARSPVAMRWSGSEPTQELVAMQGINHATNLREFTRALRHGGVPSLSFLYADRNGTIAYVPVARVPIRQGTRANLPNSGWESRYDWKGSIAMEDLPTISNPEQGYIASANNKVANNLPFFISDLWEDPSRAIRLEELLREGDAFSQVDFVQMQGDVRSPQLRYMVDFLLHAFPDSTKQGSAVRETLSRLRSWDGSMLASSAEAAIVAVWFQNVIQMTYRDELGPTLYAHYVNMAQNPIKGLRRQVLLDSRWFDDVTTPSRRENRDDILRRALGRALEDLHKRFGTWQIGQWRYGVFHTITLPHPFGSQKALRSIVNVGPFEIGGSNTTVNNGEWNFNRPYEVRVGPSMRQIVDFADTTVYMRSVVTTGASGQPLSQFYENQTVLWLANGHIALHSTPPEEALVSSVTRLTP